MIKILHLSPWQKTKLSILINENATINILFIRKVFGMILGIFFNVYSNIGVILQKDNLEINIFYKPGAITFLKFLPNFNYSIYSYFLFIYQKGFSISKHSHAIYMLM